jgi:N-acetylornithine carbamoyltransferase
MTTAAALKITRPAPAPAPAVTPRQYITGFEGGEAFFRDLLDLATAIKARPGAFFRRRPLAGKVFAALFFNPSLRTRTSMESALVRLGGHMIAQNPGSGAWGIESRKGVVMDGPFAEHIIEAAGALSSYADGLGVRVFAGMQDFAADMEDAPIRMLAEHASTPLISLESAVYHPCQALADALTLHEVFRGAPAGKRFTLSWATHPKMCGVAVPHSALLTAARLGMHVTVANPPGYDLHRPILDQAAGLAHETGGSLSFTHDMKAACAGAEVIYAKAWASPLDYGDPTAAAARNKQHGDWTVGAEHMAASSDARFMHCMPVRRNVVVTDEVIDSPASVVQQQAANRMWGQMALLLKMLG